MVLYHFKRTNVVGEADFCKHCLCNVSLVTFLIFFTFHNVCKTFSSGKSCRPKPCLLLSWFFFGESHISDVVKWSVARKSLESSMFSSIFFASVTTTLAFLFSFPSFNFSFLFSSCVFLFSNCFAFFSSCFVTFFLNPLIVHIFIFSFSFFWDADNGKNRRKSSFCKNDDFPL